MTKWKTQALGTICNEAEGNIQTGPFGSQLHLSDYTTDGIPVVMPKDIINDKINFNTVARISSTLANKLKRHKLKLNDIIFPRRGEIDKRALIEENGVGSICGTGCLKIQVPNKVLHPKFLYYYLRQPSVVEWIINQSIGATMENLNTTTLKKLIINYPQISEQTLITSILSAYDDFIEVNSNRIKILQETATQLYKEWFLRMRFPGYQKTKFEKGIPKDWKILPIGKLIDYNIGGGWGNERQTNQFSVSGYVIRGTDIPNIRKGEINKEVYRFHKPSNIKSREVKEGDIVFETAGGSEGQLLGRTCFITQEILDAYGDKVMAASFCKQIRTTSIPSLYLFYFLNYLYETGMIETFQVQSTGISNYQFEPFLKFQQIILPKENLMKSFHEKVLPIQKQIATLGQQNDQLNQIRDRLLPRLISGKLTIKTGKKTATLQD